jgi:hypothetical protein
MWHCYTWLTQLHRYTPEIFLISTATFKYIYRAPPQTNWTRIFSERRIFYLSVIEIFLMKQVPVGECPSNYPFLKNNGAEAHCF